MRTTTQPPRNSIDRSTIRRDFILVALALAFALSPPARAVSPAPDGDYGNDNTAEGANALKSVTKNGTDNTAIGFDALYSNTDGIENTAIGSGALQSNTNGPFNTAIGFQALFSNTGGDANTAIGEFALFSNTTGEGNTATGLYALQLNTTGGFNVASGYNALGANTTGYANTANGAEALSFYNTGNYNTANGFAALELNTTGSSNTASGAGALAFNSTGNYNTAEGSQALANNTGSNNIALGANAGLNLTTGSNNIVIGAPGAAGESNIILIGTLGVQKAAYIRGISGATVASGVTVIVDTKGRLGTVQSSARFKEQIKPMDKASEAILALQPVTFRYKHELDPDGTPQFGLVAEQVEKVNPDLVVRDADGKVNTVRYEAVNAMLLNEFLKEHRKVEEQEATITQLKSALVQQQKDSQLIAAQHENEIKVLAARLDEQAAQIQKVSNTLEASKAPTQLIVSSQ